MIGNDISVDLEHLKCDRTYARVNKITLVPTSISSPFFYYIVDRGLYVELLI